MSREPMRQAGIRLADAYRECALSEAKAAREPGRDASARLTLAYGRASEAEESYRRAALTFWKGFFERSGKLADSLAETK